MMLRNRVEDFIAYRADPQELRALLDDCSSLGSLEALLCIRRLFEDAYGGFTFNFELKAPGAWELACWGRPGVDQLCDAARANSSSKNLSLAVGVLCSLASGSLDSPLFCSEDQVGRIRQLLSTDSSLVDYSRHRLTELVVSMEDDGDVVDLASKGFGHGIGHNSSTAKEMFAALSARWQVLSAPVIRRYETLVAEAQNDEPTFQLFFSEYPQMLDPMATDVWPQPDLHGARSPDFVIRRSDDTYVVVEIETPGKQLVTLGNHLGAQVTHAVSQATEYRRFIERLPNADVHFPGLDELSCLVVVGLERDLSAEQKQALRNDNRQRHELRIVGFDWLSARATAVRKNTIRTGVRIHKTRIF